jgi:hypothetical protein
MTETNPVSESLCSLEPKKMDPAVLNNYIYRNYTYVTNTLTEVEQVYCNKAYVDVLLYMMYEMR